MNDWDFPDDAARHWYQIGRTDGLLQAMGTMTTHALARLDAIMGKAPADDAAQAE